MSVKVKNEAESVAAPSWKPATKRIVGLLLCTHILAVFVPPFAFQSSPIRGLGSPVADFAMDLLRPYIDFAYLNHGYAFFAPDPGPSHLLRAEISFADGRPPEILTFPDLRQHWPRLLYHRHFMLSEHLNAAFVPPEPPQEIVGNPTQLESWRFVRGMYERRRQAIEGYLLRRYEADQVKLTRIEHRLLDPYEKFELRKRRDAEDTFLVLPETEEGIEP